MSALKQVSFIPEKTEKLSNRVSSMMSLLVLMNQGSREAKPYVWPSGTVASILGQLDFQHIIMHKVLVYLSSGGYDTLYRVKTRPTCFPGSGAFDIVAHLQSQLSVTSIGLECPPLGK
ncbi:hypothetical protein RRG08_016220 [Elysia crispata]|uniref:Uncharacterized protein n=1 Tax=Elysia crispata TaxID=231223 RepID=A0AAE1DJT6_9GAST|nr:hypothetical protein RRG08_016220 [Elysia crispata]